MKNKINAAEIPQLRKRVNATLRRRRLAHRRHAVDVRWRHNKKAFARTFEDEEAAEGWRVILERAGHDVALAAIEAAPEDAIPTLDVMAEDYISSRTKLSEGSAHRYRRYMHNEISPAFGFLPVNAITRDHIVEWVQLQQKPFEDRNGAPRVWQEKTIKNKLRFLASVFEYAVEKEMCTRNPAKKVEVQETLYTEMTFLSHEEFKVVLRFIPQLYKPLILFLVSTGLRWSEATALTGADFDLKNRKVRVRKAWKWTPHGWVIGTPKTRKSNRDVPYGKEIALAIDALVRAAGRTGYVFVNGTNVVGYMVKALDGCVFNSMKRIKDA